MDEKLAAIAARYDEISALLHDPEVYADPQRAAKLQKEQKDMASVVGAWRELLAARDAMREAEETRGDPELRELADEQYESAKADIDRLHSELRVLLLPKDEDDDKSVIIEIRAGAGGDEAALFAGVLYRMYGMYADSKRWKLECLNANETELGGYKEISFSIEGVGAFARFKYESGVHRVQRVPDTEASGRIHTSTVTVAVLPEAEDVELVIDPGDLQIDTYRSGGAGGQHVNKTESAIRITHIPTGTVVECQDERSQYKNKDRAMKILRSRLLENARAKQDAEIAAERKSQVGRGMRNERIRTYNYPQSRVTDHRVGLTSHRFEQILNGDLDEIIDALTSAEQAERLAGEGEN